MRASGIEEKDVRDRGKWCKVIQMLPAKVST